MAVLRSGEVRTALTLMMKIKQVRQVPSLLKTSKAYVPQSPRASEQVGLRWFVVGYLD